MKQFHTLLALAATLALLSGCASRRSISNSSYETGYSPAFGYQGELSEFDLLGIDRNRFVTDGQIASALDSARQVRLESGETILLIQSGAAIPDSEMVSAMEERFHVVPFSGVPPQSMHGSNPARDQPGYSRTFRMAAARAGAEHVICYWGALESMRERMGTKTVSWVPVVGWMIPDENQAMRIRLKMAVIDVRTGAWTVLTPEAFTDETGMSNRFNRGRSDQKQVQELKKKAYERSVKKLALVHLQ